MVLTKARKTTSQCPAWNADANTKNLEKNPANGGIPANEKSASVMTKLKRGLVR